MLLVSLLNRSTELELLDLPVKDVSELRCNLKEISFINHILGGDAITMKGLKKLMIDRNHTYRIVDVGCGDGGMLRRIWKWAKKTGYTVNILGIDIEPEAVRYAKEQSEGYDGLNFACMDYQDYFKSVNKSPDIIISTLFCHHLTEELLKNFLLNMSKKAKMGFIINDLHRHLLAYYSIKWLTTVFSRSRLTKNDAPVSVKRGFKKKELLLLLNQLPETEYRLTWEWAFRYLVVAKHSD